MRASLSCFGTDMAQEHRAPLVEVTIGGQTVAVRLVEGDGPEIDPQLARELALGFHEVITAQLLRRLDY